MGVDIAGWVEVKPFYYDPDSDYEEHRRWVAVVDAGYLLDRNYDAFGCLFGVKNFANFAPLAAGRGIPDDASSTVREEIAQYGEEAFGASWVMWPELQAMDWEEEALRADSRLHQYKRDAQGRLVFDTKAGWDRRFAERESADRFGESIKDAVLRPGSLTFPVGQEWEIDGVVDRPEKLKRKDALGDDWRTLFNVMSALASRYGDDNVQLVVWFYW